MSAESTSTRSRTSTLVWWNAIFFALLCGSELGAMALGFDWALTGILHLGATLYIPLSVVLLAGVAWASFVAFRKAFRAERLLAGA